MNLRDSREVIMDQSGIFDETIFNFFEELYRLNNGNWKKRILLAIVQYKETTYKQIKEDLLEVPDLLVYRCIQELMKMEVISRTHKNKRSFYSLVNENKYMQDVLDVLDT